MPGGGRYMMSTLSVGDDGLTILKTVSVSPDNAARGLAAINGAILVLDAETGRGVALRIEVDQQHLQPRGRQRRGKIDGAGGLAHPALLVRDRNADHRAPTRSRITIDESVDVMLCST